MGDLAVYGAVLFMLGSSTCLPVNVWPSFGQSTCGLASDSCTRELAGVVRAGTDTVQSLRSSSALLWGETGPSL